MVKHVAAYQEAQGDLRIFHPVWDALYVPIALAGLGPRLQSVARVWGRAMLVLGGGHCPVLPQIVEPRSATHRFWHLKHTAQTTCAFPATACSPQQDRLCRKTPGSAHRRGSGSQCLVCMPRAEHRLAMKHVARRIQQRLWKRGSPDAQTTEMLVCSFRDLQLILSSRVCKNYE